MYASTSYSYKNKAKRPKVKAKQKVEQNSLPEDEPEADEAADVADEAADSFQGKKCSEKGLASDINTSKVCLQTTAEAPGWMEMVEVIEAVWPPLFLPPLLPAQKKEKTN